MKKNAMLKILKRGVLIFFAFILIGWLGNIIAFALPQSKIHANIMDSASVLKSETAFFPVIGEKYMNSIADNNTDAWMLLMADYNGAENIFQKSLGGYYKIYENTSGTGNWGFDNFISSANDSPSEIGTDSYSRYWHGWLLPLRLLLIFCSYEDIRFIGMGAILILLFYCLYILLNRNMEVYAIAFGAANLFLLPITAMISFEYSFIYYVTLIHTIILLKYYNKIEKTLGFTLYFLCLGMIASYFDFLTYPIVSLGFCSITYLFLSKKHDSGDVFHASLEIVIHSIAWGLGYAGMWISKWILGTIVLQRNVIQDAIHQLLLRTSTTDGIGEISEHTITYSSTLSRNWEVFQTRGYLILGLFTAVVLLYFVWKSRKYQAVQTNLKVLLPFTVTALMPFAWAFVFQNHTYLHRNFTSNIFTVTILSVFGYLAYILYQPDN